MKKMHLPDPNHSEAPWLLVVADGRVYAGLHDGPKLRVGELVRLG